MHTNSAPDHILNSNLPSPQRRSFLSKALVVIGTLFAGLVLYPMLQFLKQPLARGGTVNRVAAAKISEMTNDSAKIFRFGSAPAMLVRTPEGELKAFTAVCTHLDCTVQYVKGKRHILCACHNGKYDLNGQVLSGPPPRPLEEFKVFVEGEDIIVSRT